MFAGAGDFFRPVQLHKEVPPVDASPLSLRVSSDRGSAGERFRDALDDKPTDREGAAAGEEEAAVVVELSIAALQAMLTGAPPPPPVAAAPAAGEEALAAYRRAAEAVPPPEGSMHEKPAREALPYEGRLPGQVGQAGAEGLPGRQPPADKLLPERFLSESRPPDEGRAPLSAETGRAAGREIFYMLAALEKAGVRSVGVAEGQTVYDALRQHCRRADIPLVGPPVLPDDAG